MLHEKLNPTRAVSLSLGSGVHEVLLFIVEFGDECYESSALPPLMVEAGPLFIGKRGMSWPCMRTREQRTCQET